MGLKKKKPYIPGFYLCGKLSKDISDRKLTALRWDGDWLCVTVLTWSRNILKQVMSGKPANPVKT